MVGHRPPHPGRGGVRVGAVTEHADDEQDHADDEEGVQQGQADGHHHRQRILAEEVPHAVAVAPSCAKASISASGTMSSSTAVPSPSWRALSAGRW